MPASPSRHCLQPRDYAGMQAASYAHFFMEDKDLTIWWNPLFENGLFAANTLLFAPYLRNTPAYLKRRYQKAQADIAKFEERIRWPLINYGCGIQGATHPGTGKSFTNIMTGARHPLYNSDCIYLNPAQGIFAVSDSPGATTFSRTLFETLDAQLSETADVDWKKMIGYLDHTVARNQYATLALLDLDPTRQKVRARAFVAGDSQLWHGNFRRQRMVAIEGQGAFLGRLCANPEIIEVDLEEGDFFLLASDGIAAIRQNQGPETIESMLWRYLNRGMDRFAANVMAACNRIVTETTTSGGRAAFCGNDDCSILLIVPSQLTADGQARSQILGGCLY